MKIDNLIKITLLLIPLFVISSEALDINERHEVKDYVTHAQMGFPSEKRSRKQQPPTVVPLTQENLRRTGPGSPIDVSDTERTKTRMDREIQKRLQVYETQNSAVDAQRRIAYDKATSHQDALRNVVNRTVL